MERLTIDPPAERPSRLSDEVVLTVHGLLAGPRSMQPMGEAARVAGYSVVDWSYTSMRGSILKHATRLSRLVCALAESEHVRRIHCVTHSMGSVIARAAILESRLESRWPDKCGRVVMLAPPNSGSRLTRIPLGPFASWFPQLRELSESPESFVCQLPQLQRMRVGIIAAEHDFVVATGATHLTGQRDHAVVATTHQRLAQHPDAIDMSIEFLQSMRLHSLPATIPFPEPDSPLRQTQRRRNHSSAA